MEALPIQEWLQQNSVINVSGTMTALGASMVLDEITCCVEESLGRFVEMAALQAEASRTIAHVPEPRRGAFRPVSPPEFASASPPP